jgi:NADH:ubiquinone oxidoreductase subunit 4 (subunit M)
MFFYGESYLLMYIAYERTLFPVIIIIIFFGGQVEKIRAVYYLTLYALICSSPFLVVVIWVGIESNTDLQEFIT